MVQWGPGIGVMLYGLIVEDGCLLRAIPTLLARLVGIGEDVPECRLMNGKPDFVANFWKFAREFQLRYPKMHKAIGVCDADTDSPSDLEGRLMERARARLQGLPFPLVIHVIKRELETWWIADPASIRTLTGVEMPFPGGNVEDSVNDPKGYVARYLGAHRRSYTPAVAEDAARHMDLGTVSSRCPGFVRFRARVENGGVDRRF